MESGFEINLDAAKKALGGALIPAGQIELRRVMRFDSGIFSRRDEIRQLLFGALSETEIYERLDRT